MSVAVMTRLRNIASEAGGTRKGRHSIIEDELENKPKKKKMSKARRAYLREYKRRRNEMDALTGGIQAQIILTISNRLFVNDFKMKDLALATGLCPSTLARMRDRVSRRPHLQTWLKMAEATGIDVAELFSKVAKK